MRLRTAIKRSVAVESLHREWIALRDLAATARTEAEAADWNERMAELVVRAHDAGVCVEDLAS